MSSMNPSIDDYVAVTSTSRGSDFARLFSDCGSSSFESKVLCGELRLYLSQDFSLSRLFPGSISASLIVIYYAGAGVALKGNHRQRKAGFSSIAIKVNAVVAFAWIQR